jgi:hypothetical protein
VGEKREVRKGRKIINNKNKEIERGKRDRERKELIKIKR